MTRDEQFIRAMLEKHREGMRQKLMDDMGKYLSEQKLYVYILDADEYKQKLNEDNADIFLNNLLNDPYSFLYEDVENCWDGAEFAARYLVNNEPGIKYMIEGDFSKEVEEAFEGIDLDGFFTEENVLAMLSANPRYGKMLKEKAERDERRRRLYENMLDRFPDDVTKLYPYARTLKRHFVLHIGPANSGKTYEAVQGLRGGGIYLGPLRLLAYEQYVKFRDEFPCSLVTGEEREEHPNAIIQFSTVEMMDPLAYYPYAVIDEAQMLSDMERGSAWTAAILGLAAAEIHVCAAPHAKKMIVRLIEACGDTYEVKQHQRSVPLEMEEGCVTLKHIRKGDALIVFSRRQVHALAKELSRRHIRCSVIYGALPYDVRQNEAERFRKGETDVVVATDAIGMGMNLPIQRVVFMETEKYDGVGMRLLYPEEVQQIAGRAGRMGLCEKGLVNAISGKKEIRKMLRQKVPAIKEAMVDMPKNLIYLDGKLSEIFRLWESMEMPEGIRRMDSRHDAVLCEMLEKYTDDKELIYFFVTIPFDDNRQELLDLWKELFLRQLEGKPIPVEDAVGMVLSWTSMDNMESLEGGYRYLDMLFFYYSRLGEDVDPIIQEKKELSNAIISLLSKGDYAQRKCKCCGRVLAWDSRYGMCRKCHDRIYANRYREYYGDVDFD